VQNYPLRAILRHRQAPQSTQPLPRRAEASASSAERPYPMDSMALPPPTHRSNWRAPPHSDSAKPPSPTPMSMGDPHFPGFGKCGVRLPSHWLLLSRAARRSCAQCSRNSLLVQPFHRKHDRSDPMSKYCHRL
jgi:hypothetical protein